MQRSTRLSDGYIEYVEERADEYDHGLRKLAFVLRTYAGIFLLWLSRRVLPLPDGTLHLDIYVEVDEVDDDG